MSRLASLPLDISTSSLLPYIPPKDLDTFCSSPRLESWCYDPNNIRHYLSLHKDFDPSTSDQGLRWSLASNSLVLAKYYISQGVTNRNEEMIYAADRGKIKIVSFLMNYSANSYNNAMATAAFSGHINIVRLMLNLGAKNYNEAMNLAAYKGHINIVEQPSGSILEHMLELGANDYDWAMREALRGKHYDIVGLLGEAKLNARNREYL